MTDHCPDDTRQKILNAALAVFAEEGFQAASVREICRRAQVNAALAHYHFGDKVALYRETFRQTLPAATDTSFMDREQAPLAVLQRFYRELLAPLGEDHRRQQMLRVHAREQIEPSGVLGDLYLETVRPKHEALVRFLCQQLQLPAPDTEVHRLAYMLAGMAVLFVLRRPLIEGLSPDVLATPEAVTVLADHLAAQAVWLIQHEITRRK